MAYFDQGAFGVLACDLNVSRAVPVLDGEVFVDGRESE